MNQIQVNHPGMTKQFLDAAFHRAMLADISLSKTARPGVFAVSSTQDDDLYYLTTRETCSCIAGQRLGRCCHRALAIVWMDIMRHIEVGSALYDEETAS